MTAQETEQLDLLVTVRVKAGDAAEREALFQEKAAETLAHDEGCLRYEWYRAKDAPDTYYLLERWANRAALDAHLAAPHLTALFDRFRALAPEAFVPADLVRLQG